MKSHPTAAIINNFKMWNLETQRRRFCNIIARIKTWI